MNSNTAGEARGKVPSSMRSTSGIGRLREKDKWNWKRERDIYM